MSHYIGRFAPSPSGPLHLGSLYTAVASYLDAKSNNGQWLLRIEDLDPPREQPGAIESIIHSLQAHSLQWDNNILYQSQRHLAYDDVIKQLLEQQLAFYCDCSRQKLAAWNDVYPGFCRNQFKKPDHPCAIRLKADPPALPFFDRLLGKQYPPTVEKGVFHDFVIYRKDGFYAYQLAVVVDDIAQQITHVVRGSDILDSTFKQEYLYRYLGCPIPQYLHLPVITDKNNQKLSKQNLAQPIDDTNASENLLSVLRLLGQPLPPAIKQTTPTEILSWATQHWNIDKISKSIAIRT